MPAPPVSVSLPSFAIAEDGRPSEEADASVDKTIVDRRAGHRSTGSRRALHDARDRMQSDSADPRRFRNEFMHIHAARLRAARVPLFVLCTVAATAVAPTLSERGWIVGAVWLACALVAIFAGDRLAENFEAEAAEGASLAPWRARFHGLQATHGVVWASFVFLTHPMFAAGWVLDVFGPGGLPCMLAVGVLLVVGSVHLTVAHALPGGVSWVCGPILVAVIGFATPGTLAGNGDAAVAFVGAATLTVIFSMLGVRLLGYARANVRAGIEKDDAVMEADEARHLSDEARRRAEEANMAKTRFLATMSHELRTPLNAILGFSELMEAEMMGPLGNPKYKEYVADIHSSGAHLLKLINEILDLSRVEAGRYELDEEAVDLTALARDAMQMLKLKASEKNIALQIRAEPVLPAVWADERAVRQVILNLLSNAVKFTPKGGQVVVKVGWTGSGGEYVTVSDNGPGIAEEEIPIVLSSFGQGSVALRSAEPGSGLGLPIVQAFMKIHEGRLDLKSKLREGTSVTVMFPRKRVMTQDVARAA